MFTWGTVRTWLMTALLLTAGGTAANAATSCVVADPSPTPLNVRAAPGQSGAILTALEDGYPVTIQSSATHKGQPWALITDQAGTPLGWVFQRYLDCAASPPVIDAGTACIVADPSP